MSTLLGKIRHAVVPEEAGRSLGNNLETGLDRFDVRRRNQRKSDGNPFGQNRHIDPQRKTVLSIFKVYAAFTLNAQPERGERRICYKRATEALLAQCRNALDSRGKARALNHEALQQVAGDSA